MKNFLLLAVGGLLFLIGAYNAAVDCGVPGLRFLSYACSHPWRDWKVPMWILISFIVLITLYLALRLGMKWTRVAVQLILSGDF
jgi:hypothetical protein